MIERIKIGEKEIILVGTAHISEESVSLVKKTIEEENPDVVGIELDAQRFEQLKSEKKWQETNISEVVKTGKAYLFLINLLLSNMQRQFGLKVGVKPGSEMLEAANIAQEKKIPIALLDRDVRITMKRAFSLMGFWEKLKLLGTIFTGFFSEQEELTKEKVESLKNEDVMTKLIQELSSTAPTLKRVLVDERDAFIADNILKIPGKKIVAVVGAGHLKGMKKNLKNPPANILEFSQIPEKKSMLKYVAYLIPIIFVVVLFFAFQSTGIDGILKISVIWILVTGISSALGVVLARGHIFSVLTAFVAAPITTLHPALASGWFAAAVEAKMNMPKVKDFDNLNELNSIGDFYKNKVTKILLVATFSNIGSTIGLLVALPIVLSLIG
ncbi:MAG: TraB/GumN family protein [Candidatus Diapherotrites archaeon]|nr:TraB/GumN family protein [Candidatus Diapherotrites archaeon]